ncbi:diacylglycerol kinase catalytic domain-containing protein [Xylariales sp. AK1849]|nr:diacylglycerol kinase catalytic domain-containing protein [Xylariales sp. AK1849]
MATQGQSDGRHRDSLDCGTINPIGSAEPEELVCVVRRNSGTSGYGIYSLKEEVKDQGKRFQLVTHEASDLPQYILEDFLVGDVPEYLCSSATRKVHVVVSTGSGTGTALSFYQSALEPLLKVLGFSSVESTQDIANDSASDKRLYTLTITEDAHSIRKFAGGLTESDQSPDGSKLQHTVVLLSGDGGIIEILNGKVPADEADVPKPSLPLIAMMPLGTGNALFHSLHRPLYAPSGSAGPSPLVLGLRTLLKGQQAPLPSFRVDFSSGSRSIAYSSPDDKHTEASGIEETTDSISRLYGVIVASYGFHSQLVWESDTPDYRKHGDKRFGIIAAELLKESHAYAATVELGSFDGSALRRIDRNKHAYILATMVSNLEKTFTISPASRPLDGRLRLIHFGAVGSEKTLDIMKGAYDDGKHVGMQWTTTDGKSEEVGYEDTNQVRVTTLEQDSRWRKVCIDGIIVEIPQGGSMTVRTEKSPHLQVLVHRTLSLDKTRL